MVQCTPPLNGPFTVSNRDDFLDSFHDFTCHAFAGFSPRDWENVVVAGGAIVQALSPAYESGNMDVCVSCSF